MSKGKRPRRVERYLQRELQRKGALHMALIDPDKCTPSKAAEIAQVAKCAGSAAIMIGGSTGITQEELDAVVKAIKKSCRLPVILFPGSLQGLSRYADAVWFLSVLNSTDPYYITEAQALGAILVKKYGLEALPLGYIIVGEGGAAGYFSRAAAVPLDHPEIAALYALAAQYMGMRFVYLERGSGAPSPVPPEMVGVVRRTIDVPLIVGGGIRTGRDAFAVVTSGADIVVTGTVIEESSEACEEKLREIVAGIEQAAEGRRHGK